MSNRKIRVFLVDDHELIRRGLRDCMEAEQDLVVVGEAGTAGEAARLIPAIMPEVVVLDVRLPDGNGIEVCLDLRSVHPQIRFLILTTFSDDEALFDAIVAGADGYVLKDTRGDNLIESIRRVAAAPTRAAKAPSITTIPVTRTSLSSAPNSVMAKFFSHGGVKSICSSPTTTTGDPLAPVSPATSCPTPSAAPAASTPATAPSPAHRASRRPTPLQVMMSIRRGRRAGLVARPRFLANPRAVAATNTKCDSC